MKGIFKVGGCVRDELLNVPSKDVDYVAVGYTAEEFKDYKLVGKDFPVFLNEKGEEIALARTERKTGSGYNGFTVKTENVSLRDDLERRDLTINSIAKRKGRYYDPFGGMKDIKNKILRHTSEAFAEDPLRVLRLARFYARLGDFTIAEETKALCYKLKDELKHLTKERVSKEVLKVMEEKNPQKFFECLLELDVLDVLFPEIYAMVGCEHNNNYHMEGDVFNHTMKALYEVSLFSEDILTRMGVLYHDIGKPTSKELYGVMHNHDSEDLLHKILNDLKDRYRYSKEIYRVIYFSARYHHFIHKIEEMNKKNIVHTFMKRDFPRNEKELKILLDVAKADEYGRIVLIDSKLIEGKEISKNKDWILDAYKRVKEVKLDKFDFPNLEAQKQYLLGKRKFVL